MSFIQFDKEQLVNLEYSLKREMLRSNRFGAYSSSTLVGCNTRKYHGLLVVPQPGLDHERHVLLSCLDESLVVEGKEFNLALHKFPGLYHPRGHKYITDYSMEPNPHITFTVNDISLSRSSLLLSHKNAILIRYKLESAPGGPKTLRFKPFLAFRNFHSLSKANMNANKKIKPVKNGIQNRLYDGYDPLFLQLSKSNEFIQVPEWYYNFEYLEERDRGYPYQEDLYNPGFFEITLKEGEEVFFLASTEQLDPKSFKKLFNEELKVRTPRKSFQSCLENAASQFLIKSEHGKEVIAGYHWFGRWGRDTLIALPGLTLSLGDIESFEKVIKSLSNELSGGLFPNVGHGEEMSYNSVDAPMWFFWAIQEYVRKTGNHEKAWKKWGKSLIEIIDAFRSGNNPDIYMDKDGLIYAKIEDKALTWMDAIAPEGPVTQRGGKPVEINALWYNGLQFTLDLANKNNKDSKLKGLKELIDQVGNSFVESYWDEEKGYLADVISGNDKDFSVRPNMAIAAGVEFSPLNEIQRISIIETIKRELLTSKGLRTLAPKNPFYKGHYFGKQADRDRAYHQGTVWPWLLMPYADALVHIYGKDSLPILKSMAGNFEEDMTVHGVSSISEIYEGDPPHAPRGAISQAWSVAAVLRILEHIENLSS